MPGTDGRVQVIPLVDVASGLSVAAATNNPPPNITEFQFAAEGIVLLVQVIPFVEVAAAVVEPVATAKNTPAPKVTLLQFCLLYTSDAADE